MICISWLGLTPYAAKCIRAFCESCEDKVKVVQLPARRFVHGNLCEMCGCEILDVERDDKRALTEVVGCVPNVFVLAGWYAPSLVRWAKEVKHNGGIVILASDEAFTGKTLKQYLRKFRFLVQYNRWIDKVFVCGKGGLIQFVDFYGLPPAKVFIGNYAADSNVFFNGPPLNERANRFIYVGKFDENKNILLLCEAFRRVHAAHPEWEFEICGNGPLERDVGRYAGIEKWTADVSEKGNGFILTGFVDNAKLGEKYRNARCFVLGSKRERWGVVVHEAAASGCMLLLSRNVGSRYDFATEENSAIFDPHSIDDAVAAMERIVSFDSVSLDAAQNTSVTLSAKFSPAIYAHNLKQAIVSLTNQTNGE